MIFLLGVNIYHEFCDIFFAGELRLWPQNDLKFVGTLLISVKILTTFWFYINQGVGRIKDVILLLRVNICQMLELMVVREFVSKKAWSLLSFQNGL